MILLTLNQSRDLKRFNLLKPTTRITDFRPQKLNSVEKSMMNLIEPGKTWKASEKFEDLSSVYHWVEVNDLSCGSLWLFYYRRGFETEGLGGQQCKVQCLAQGHCNIGIPSRVWNQPAVLLSLVTNFPLWTTAALQWRWWGCAEHIESSGEKHVSQNLKVNLKSQCPW